MNTDLADEAYALAQAAYGPAGLEGVDVQVEQLPHGVVRRFRVAAGPAAVRLGKSPGTYVTIDAPSFWQRSQPEKESLAQVVARELASLLRGLRLSPQAPVLVAGLGNWNATPDSLGPRVVQQLLVTRHLGALLPPEKRGALRPVAAISPGVLGLTGVETSELVGAVVERIRPAAVIGVDALAAASLDRLCSTVQLADAGIEPGAGVGNRRTGLNRQTLGVPVIAMGLPTVIHASRLAAGTLPPVRDGQLPGGLVVTPKEIDLIVDQAAELLAGAINAALHEGVHLDEVLEYLR
ncbi:MAG TPA: GPR endopeptidase [Limnochordales bacterium]